MKTATIRTTLIFSVILTVASLSAAKAAGQEACYSKCHTDYIAAENICKEDAKLRNDKLAPQRELYNKGASNTFLEQEGASNTMLNKCINLAKNGYKACEQNCPK